MHWQWWWWVAMGFVLLGFEILTPGGFFVMFFGISGVAVGLLSLAGVVTADWMQWLLFSVFSLLSLAFFRKPMLARFQKLVPLSKIDEISGQTAVVLEPMAPRQKGKVELRGSSWNAFNEGEEVLGRGETCVVLQVQGLQLHVTKEKVG